MAEHFKIPLMSPVDSKNKKIVSDVTTSFSRFLKNLDLQESDIITQTKTHITAEFGGEFIARYSINRTNYSHRKILAIKHVVKHLQHHPIHFSHFLVPIPSLESYCSSPTLDLQNLQQKYTPYRNWVHKELTKSTENACCRIYCKRKGKREYFCSATHEYKAPLIATSLLLWKMNKGRRKVITKYFEKLFKTPRTLILTGLLKEKGLSRLVLEYVGPEHSFFYGGRSSKI